MSSILGRRNYYRLARFLWMDARRDVDNQMGKNGEFKLLNRLVACAAKQNRPVFFDIGCNVGKYSNMLLDYLVKHRINDAALYCFEPNPDCCAQIRKRLKTHVSWHQANLVERAVTDTSEKVSFFIKGPTAGTSSPKGQSGNAKGTRAYCGLPYSGWIL